MVNTMTNKSENSEFNNYIVGNVISVDGLKITILMHQNTNMLSYFYNGVYYRGVNIGEYIGITRGPYKIVVRVEKEYLIDKFGDNQDQTYSINRFERHIEASVIGSFFKGNFIFGIRCLPMIFNEVILLTEDEISQVIGCGLNKNKEVYFVNIGNSVQENIKVDIPINGLYNSHIGVFGNTGSGKSNTLTKLYTELFNHNDLDVTKKSKFIILDFNGEYTGSNVFCVSNKKVINLSTRNNNGDKIKLHSKNFWNKETLSILFSATEKTQQPFIEKMLNYYFKDKKLVDKNTILRAVLDSFQNTFAVNQHRESASLLKKIYSLIGIDDGKGKYGGYDIPLYNVEWNNKYGCYWENNKAISNDDVQTNKENFKNSLEENLMIEHMSIVDELEVVFYAQLIFGLAYNHFQFEHINPLISRVEASRNFIEKTIEISNEDDDEFLTIISFKNCNQDAKKVIPLLVSKQLYNEHIKTSNTNGKIEKTCHLIIDEAHNILSQQSTREAESFKDYRLKVFEQIVKEGRKYGFYLTISSQRPYDISSTIISQLHNYFIHRLVNDMDLKMLANTINTLDLLSKERIPNLAPGQCIITGTLFDLPLVIQVKKLDDDKAPNSNNADIINLWKRIQ